MTSSGTAGGTLDFIVFFTRADVTTHLNIYPRIHIPRHNLPSAPVRLPFRPCRGKLQLIELLEIMGQLMGQGIEDRRQRIVFPVAPAQFRI